MAKRCKWNFVITNWVHPNIHEQSKKQKTWIEKIGYIGVKCDNIIQLQITLFQLFFD